MQLLGSNIMPVHGLDNMDDTIHSGFLCLKHHSKEREQWSENRDESWFATHSLSNVFVTSELMNWVGTLLPYHVGSKHGWKKNPHLCLLSVRLIRRYCTRRTELMDIPYGKTIVRVRKKQSPQIRICLRIEFEGF